MDRPLWHITDNPDWALDPTYHPRWAYWATGGPTREPGIFVSDHPSYWEPYFGRGPLWAVRVAYHGELPPGYTSPEHPEYLLTDFDKIEVLEVLPLAEAIRRGQEAKAAGLNWDQHPYNDFTSLEHWWYACREVWNDRKMRTEQVCRPRRGLEELMKEWKDEHGGRSPRQVARWREGFEQKFGRRPRPGEEPWAE